MRLTVVGCGTAAPDAERVGSGYLVEHDDLRLLLDCGPGVLHRMAEFKLDWPALTHLALTHFHVDHIGDLSALFFAWKYGQASPRDTPLTVIGPVGLKTLIDELPNALGGHIRDPGFPLSLVEVRDGTDVDLSDARLRVAATRHTSDSVAYRVEANGRTIGYTGDTGPDPELGRFFAGVDLLVAECSLPDEIGIPVHLTPTSVAELAMAAEPGTLLLTHVYPQLDRRRLVHLVASAGWSGRTSIAHDGVSVEI